MKYEILHQPDMQVIACIDTTWDELSVVIKGRSGYIARKGGGEPTHKLSEVFGEAPKLNDPVKTIAGIVTVTELGKVEEDPEPDSEFYRRIGIEGE